MPTDQRPIGIFDSGLGGLSVLRALQAELPHERFVYLADNGYAPYGDRDDDHVLRRSHVITDFMVAAHGIKALVVACNTATAAAIHTLRAAYAALPIIGIEPALKPAANQSKTGVVGVMATRATLGSEKFSKLLESLQGKAQFVLQPCDGLAYAIECSDTTLVQKLCREYTQAMGSFGTAPGQMDTLVLGCTHYAFVSDTLLALAKNQTVLIDGGAPVARQTRRLLEQAGELVPSDATSKQAQTVFYSTGDLNLLNAAVQRWLQLDARTIAIDPPGN